MDILAKLNEKINGLLKRYNSLKEENENLKLEYENIKALLEEKDLELLKCKEEIALKELEAEEILTKIETIIEK